MQNELEITVRGIPEPKGSTKAFNPFHATKKIIDAIALRDAPSIIISMVRRLRPIVTTDNPKNKAWQKTVAKRAAEAFDGQLWTGPVELSFQFYLPRCKAAAKRQWHTKKPDVDKLVRCATDALTGIVYKDDSQVVRGFRSKEYEIVGGAGPGVVIHASRLDAEQLVFTPREQPAKILKGM